MMMMWLLNLLSCLQVDVQDPRFQAMFTSHLFNLDPSHPSYKKTRATQSIEAEKQRRRRRHEEEEEEEQRQHLHQSTQDAPKTAANKRERDSDASGKKTTMDPSLSLLVKSIKSKTEQFQARKKQKTL